jgi:hypothetical protein
MPMQDAYINTLSARTQELVNRIEQHIQSEIVVEVDGSRVGTLACEVDLAEIKILIPENGYFPEPSVVHELIHIRRFCVEKVPKIAVCDAYDNWSPEIEDAFVDLDNNLEHFVIVPEEIKLFPDRREYWEACISSRLGQLDSGNTCGGNTQGSVLMYWTFLRHVFPRSELFVKANAIVEKLGISEAVQSCFTQTMPCIETKEKLVRAWFSNLDIPLGAGCLVYIDFRNHSNKEIAVASVVL